MFRPSGTLQCNHIILHFKNYITDRKVCDNLVDEVMSELKVELKSGEASKAPLCVMRDQRMLADLEPLVCPGGRKRRVFRGTTQGDVSLWLKVCI